MFPPNHGPPTIFGPGWVVMFQIFEVTPLKVTGVTAMNILLKNVLLLEPMSAPWVPPLDEIAAIVLLTNVLFELGERISIA